MRYALSLLLIASFGFFTAACSENTPVSNRDAVATPEAEPSPPIATQEQESEKKSKVVDLLDFANKVIEKVDDSGNQADKAKQWMNEQFGGGSGDAAQVADDAAKWAADAFKKLKGTGMTTAGTPGQWLQEDISNMNALDYKVVSFKLDDLDALEDELNRLGKLRWNCFHVVEKTDQSILFFKREKRSMLKNLPVRDMMKLIPLMNNN